MHPICAHAWWLHLREKKQNHVWVIHRERHIWLCFWKTGVLLLVTSNQSQATESYQSVDFKKKKSEIKLSIYAFKGTVRKIQTDLWTVVNNYIYCLEKDFFLHFSYKVHTFRCFKHLFLSSTTILNLNLHFTFNLWVIFLPVIVIFLYNAFVTPQKEHTCWHSLSELFLESA